MVGRKYTEHFTQSEIAWVYKKFGPCV